MYVSFRWRKFSRHFDAPVTNYRTISESLPFFEDANFRTFNNSWKELFWISLIPWLNILVIFPSLLNFFMKYFFRFCAHYVTNIKTRHKTNNNWQKKSQTNMRRFVDTTSLTFDFTAIFEGTATVNFYYFGVWQRPPAATHNITAFFGWWIIFTLATSSAERSQRFVRTAKRRRFLRVNQIHLPWTFDCFPFGHVAMAVVSRDYLDGTIEVLFEFVADFSEIWHFSCARLERARAGDAMTFAFYSHVVADRL